MRINLNGKMLSSDQATIPVLDHGFLFGDSVYEVIRTANGRLLTAREHIERLRESAAAIRLPLPLTDEQFLRELERTHAEAGHAESYLRLVVTRGVGEIELLPRSCRQPNWLIIAKPLAAWPESCYTDGIPVCLAHIHRNPDSALSPRIKSGNYLNNALALMEAADVGAGEAIMLNPDGWVTEATTSNVWIVRDGAALTPSLDCGLLRGITRGILLEIARAHGVPARETRISAGEMLGADEVFLSGTTRGVMPVRQVDQTRIGSGRPGPVTRRLHELLEERLRAN
ncbi:MAG: aminotransferase class IV [Planctomycetes bacterium]|nr:aminotransferase class IV [Planctomycetota bacterium]